MSNSMSRNVVLSAAISSLILVTSGGRANGELNLSPESELFELDGMKLSQLTFNNGASGKASYQPPRNWKYAGGKDELDLRPPNLSQANVKITKVASQSFSLDDQGREELKQATLRSLPEGSQDIEVMSEELDPLQIDGKHTYLVEASYLFFGEKFVCYSLILDRKPEAMKFRLSCREKDYQELRAAFARSLYSWQNL
ncbi:MAG: hypothetical protein ACREIF_02055 [Chthoniobacterales bacterium]